MLGIVSDIVMPLALAFIMFSLGLGVTLKDFAAALRRPAALLGGLAAQILLLPLVAFGVVWAFGLTGAQAFGVMVLSVCPGGVTSNMFAKLAGGRVALSISLTAVTTLLSAITIPLWLVLWAKVFLGEAGPSISAASLALTMFAITVVPVLVGLTLRHWAPRWAEAAEPTLSRAANTLFWLFILAAVIVAWGDIRDDILPLSPPLLTLTLLLTSLGWLIAALLRLEHKDRVTLAIECGLQNGSVGLTLIGLIFGLGTEGIPPAAIPIGIYSLVMYVVHIPLLAVFRRGQDAARTH